MNQFYDMWDMDYVQQQAKIQQHHYEQQLQVTETIKKFQDYLDSCSKLDPQYRPEAISGCCSVLVNYMLTHKIL